MELVTATTAAITNRKNITRTANVTHPSPLTHVFLERRVFVISVFTSDEHTVFSMLMTKKL
jgi:hypothetical protein